MILRHIIREVRARWVSVLLLGIMIALSSFVYTSVDLGIGAVERETDAYFETTNQEDFAISVTPLLSESDLDHLDTSCLYPVFTLNGLYQEDQSCFNNILNGRIDTMEDIADITLEARLYKDVSRSDVERSHDIRVMKNSETINKTYLENGRLPESSDEIGLLKNYMVRNGLSIGDTIKISESEYAITGEILVPDYTLPALTHPFLFTTDNQSIAVMTDDAFHALNASVRLEIAGVFNEETTDLESAFAEADHDFYMGLTLTENNFRSGIIYTEIEGSKGTALFISVLIAFIGIVVVGLIFKKLIERSRRPFGILRSLGMTERELFVPFLVSVLVFSVLFLGIGYYIGYLSGPWIRDFFLDFYLLPRGDIIVSYEGVLIAVFVPLFVLMAMSAIILKRLLSKEPLDLIHMKVESDGRFTFKTVQRLIRKLNYFTRMQIAMLLRNFVKVTVFMIAIFSALIISFMSIGMFDIFTGTVDDYYESIDVRHIGYLETPRDIDTPQEKVIETQGTINGSQAFLIGLDPKSELHPLTNRDGEDIRDDLHEGIVISRSFSLLASIHAGDAVTIRLAGTSYETTVSGVADIYPGEHVFISREVLAQTFFDDSDYFNAVYSSEPLDEEAFMEVFTVQSLIDSMDEVHDLIMNVLYVVMATGLVLGMVIVYLLSVLTVEDNYYNIALFKVLGYTNREINKIVIGGYDKLTVLIFILSIPATMGIYRALTWFIATEYQMVMPFTFEWLNVLVIGAMYGIIYVLASLKAKRKIHAVSLQAALKIYQH